MASKGKAIGVLLRELSEDTIPNKRTFKDLEVSKDSGARGRSKVSFNGDLAYSADGKLAVAFDAGAKPSDAASALVDADAGLDVDAGIQRVNTMGGQISVESEVEWWFNSDGKKGLFGNK